MKEKAKKNNKLKQTTTVKAWSADWKGAREERNRGCVGSE